ncbi:uncharacterized protein METZ01_LOCUS241691, partial [marine metagenome]
SVVIGMITPLIYFLEKIKIYKNIDTIAPPSLSLKTLNLYKFIICITFIDVIITTT